MAPAAWAAWQVGSQRSDREQGASHRVCHTAFTGGLGFGEAVLGATVEIWGVQASGALSFPGLHQVALLSICFI